jgi:hypothetical protein
VPSGLTVHPAPPNNLHTYLPELGRGRCTPPMEGIAKESRSRSCEIALHLMGQHPSWRGARGARDR